MRRRVPKKHSTFHLIINPHPTYLPKSNFSLLPDQNNARKDELDPIKDSALNIISLNIRSLTLTSTGGGGQKSPTVTFNINNFLTNGPMDL